MNTPLLGLSVAALLLTFAGQAAAAESSSPSAPVTGLVVDCADRALPPQHEVGQLLDQHNLGQVHASRARLMVEVARACRRERVARVLLVPAMPATGMPVERRVARQRRQ